MVTKMKTVTHNGTSYGLEVIGDKKSHYKYRTPDGKKHRSEVGAVRHIEEKKMATSMLNLEKRWGVTLSA